MAVLSWFLFAALITGAVESATWPTDVATSTPHEGADRQRQDDRDVNGAVTARPATTRGVDALVTCLNFTGLGVLALGVLMVGAYRVWGD